MNNLSLAIQNTYDAVEVALFTDKNPIAVLKEPKSNASKLLVPMISCLLKEQNLEIKDLKFITVNQGPGPFTTLRVVIATVNGLSFATGLPLIGVDGIKALITQYQKPAFPTTIALMDAFNKDVYFAIEHNGQFQSGYGPIASVTEKLRHYTDQPVLILGNALTLYQDVVEQAVGSRAEFDPHAAVSILHIGTTGVDLWLSQQQISNQLFPLYLKQQFYKNQQGIMTAI